MPTAHCVSSPQGVILEADQGFANLVRRPLREIPGLSYREITHPGDLGISAKMLASLVVSAPPIQLRKRYLRPDGSHIDALLFVTYFQNPDRLVSTLFWNEDGYSRHPKRLWEAALRIRHMDKVRKAAFGDLLAFDPVGSLLITIYLAEAEGRVLGTDQLAEEAGLRPSTTERWLKALRQHGVIRYDDASSYIQFSDAGFANIELTLESAFYEPTLLSEFS
jgi:hypothetical protein